MAKHLSALKSTRDAEFSLIGNAWHKCERFRRLGVECPYRTANIEQDDEQPPEGRRGPIPLISPPARSRKLQSTTTEVQLQTKVFDIRDLMKLPLPEPALPEGPRPDRPIPPRPVEPFPQAPIPGSNIDRLPDGMPIIDPAKIPGRPNINPAAIGGLIKFLNQNFITGLANKPAFSLPPLTSPLPRSLGLPKQQLDSFLLQEFAEMAASQERTFASQFASSFKPAGTIESEVNRDSSARRESEGEGRTGITRRQIAGAGAAMAAGLAGAEAVRQSRGGGGGFGGMHRPSRFPRDLRTAQ